MDDFKTKKRVILTGLALLLVMDGALAITTAGWRCG